MRSYNHESIPLWELIVKSSSNIGCVSFFCTRLFWNRRGGKRASEKRFAPGIARARTTSWLLREGLSRRRGGSMDQWVGQPVHPRSPEDEEPKGLCQLLLTSVFAPTR